MLQYRLLHLQSTRFAFTNFIEDIARLQHQRTFSSAQAVRSAPRRRAGLLETNNSALSQALNVDFPQVSFSIPVLTGDVRVYALLCAFTLRILKHITVPPAPSLSGAPSENEEARYR